MTNINDTLLKKLLSGSPPPLIIITPHSETEAPEDYLNQWILQYLSRYIAAAKNIQEPEAVNLLTGGHPDIVSIKKPEHGKNYSIGNEDLKEFFFSQQFKNWELPSRVITIERVDLISEAYANKMLKTLEEPAPGTITFLLNPFGKKVLSTIQSRSISLRLPRQAKTNQDELILKSNEEKRQFILGQFKDEEKYHQQLQKLILEQKGLHKLTQTIKENPSFKQKLLRVLVEAQSKGLNDYQQEQYFLEEYRWFQHSQVFHGMAAERFYGLLDAVCQLNSRQD